MLFDPEVYKGKEQELLDEGKALTQEQLIEYAKMVTEVRADIVNRANMVDAAELK